MPYSSVVFDPVIAKIIKFVKTKNFLDLGAGAGKYGALARKIDPSMHLTAVEIEKDYIKKFNLDSIYSEVLNMSVTDLLRPKYYDSKFDFIMCGDIIEHLKKSDGIDLLNFLIYRSRWIVIEFPHRYLINSVDGRHSGAHISVWGENDFESFERTELYKSKKVGGTQRLIVLRGYLENEIPVEKVNALINNLWK